MPPKGYVVVILLFLSCNANAQNIITDTIFIDFNTDSLIFQDYFLDKVVDKRKEHPRVVSYYQTKKLLLVPIDNVICLNKPLAPLLQQSNSRTLKPENPRFRIDIHYFMVDRYNGKLFKQYRLLADMSLYQVENDTSSFIGTLSYSFGYKPRTKKPKSAAVMEVLSSWHQKFKIDMLTTTSYLKNKQNKPESLLEQHIKRPYHISLSAVCVYGYNFWQIEGELNLLRPETGSRYWNMANLIRYQKADGFELFAYGKKSEHFSKRFSNNWKLDVSSNMLTGFIKWNNPDEIKLFQLFQISVSSSQSICFDRKNQQGMIFKAGIFENAYYLVQKPLGMQIGLYFSTGYKF